MKNNLPVFHYYRRITCIISEYKRMQTKLKISVLVLKIINFYRYHEFSDVRIHVYYTAFLDNDRVRHFKITVINSQLLSSLF